MVRDLLILDPALFSINLLIISYGTQDVYRIGTLMELVRVLALSFADDGKRVKVDSHFV